MPGNEILALVMFAAFIGLVFTGFPIAWILAGLAILFTALAIVLEVDFGLAIGVDWAYASIGVERIWNVMENWVMVALPMFIFMGLHARPLGYRRPADDQFRAPVRPRLAEGSPSRWHAHRRTARRHDGHYRRLCGAAGATRPARSMLRHGLRPERSPPGRSARWARWAS